MILIEIGVDVDEDPPPNMMIEGAIKPYGDDTVELSMKAPMSMSKPTDLE